MTAMLPTLSTLFHKHNGISILLSGDLKTELPNGIKIYRNKKAGNTITCLVNKYPSIWESLGFVQVFLEHWMKVYLKPG